MTRRNLLASSLFTSTLLAFSAVVFPVLAQNQPPSQKKPAIAAHSDVVLVPVVVTDHSGAHVADLTQSAFTVFGNGHPQQIAFFHHIHMDPAAHAAAPPPPLGEFTNSIQTTSERSAILVFDLLNSSLTEQSSARDELMKFFLQSPALTQPVCLLAVDAEGVRVLHDFTKDPALLAGALQSTKNQRSPKDAPITDPLESSFKTVQGWNTRSSTHNTAANQGRQDVLDYTTNAVAADLGARSWLTLESLREIGEAYAGLPGRKSLIWATGGFPFQMGDASHFGQNERALLPAYEAAWRTLARGNIAVYPLDVEDLINPVYVGANTGTPLFQRIGITSDVEKLESFAESTGGKLCDRQTTVLGCLNAADYDSSDYYLIGFYENSGKSNSGWHKLAVKVDRPGVQVRSRSGYYVRGSQDEATNRKQDVLIALDSPLDFTALHFTVRLTTNNDANGKKNVGFVFLIPPAGVTVDESDNNHVSLDFAALAEKSDGTRMEGGYSRALEGHLKTEGIETLRAKGLSFPASIDLPPGKYSVRFVIRDNIAGQVGSLTGPLTVP